MIKPKCCRCKNELTEFGAILLSPPKIKTEDLMSDHIKQHLCVDCYWDIQKFIITPILRTGDFTKDHKTDPIFSNESTEEIVQQTMMPKHEIQKIKHKEDYMGERIIYWFDDKKDLLKWVDIVTEASVDTGTIDMPRFGGNFIDVEPEAFTKFIGWVFPDCERVGISGYTGGRGDLIVDEILLLPKEGIETKKLRQRAHISRADEVSDEKIKGKTVVRCWWD